MSYLDLIIQGPFCPSPSGLLLLNDFSTSVTKDTSAMERVLTAYENNMRPSSFQCCRTSLDDYYVTGFRMYLTEFPFATENETSDDGLEEPQY